MFTILLSSTSAYLDHYGSGDHVQYQFLRSSAFHTGAARYELGSYYYFNREFCCFCQRGAGIAGNAPGYNSTLTGIIQCTITYGVVPLAAIPITTSLSLIACFCRSSQPCSQLSSACSTGR